MRRLVVTGIVAACALWATPIASAGTVTVESSYSGYRLMWEGEPGEDNDVLVETGSNGETIVRERGNNARLVALEGQLPCDVEGKVATCGPASFQDYQLRGGEGDDKLSTQGVTESWWGYFSDYLSGGGGHDVLDGADHNLCCIGSTLDPGHGNDVMHGGSGDYDQAIYYYRDDDLDISFAPRPADARNGAVGEHDVIGDDVEDIQTGSGDDVVYGDDRNNRISSYGGADELHGGGGHDSVQAYSSWWDPADDVYGGDGNDSLSSGALHGVVDGGPGYDSVSTYANFFMTLTLDGVANDGGIIDEHPYWPNRRRQPNGDVRQIENLSGSYLNDFIAGDDLQNYLAGYQGSDVIVAGGGGDTVYADVYWDNSNQGNDFVDIRDGEVDFVDCGPGTDTVAADDADAVSGNCENVRYEKLPIPEVELPPDPEPPPAPVYYPPTYTPSPVVVQQPGVPLPGQWFDPPPLEETSEGGGTDPPPRPACAVLETSREPKKLAGGAEAECLVGAGGSDRLAGNAGDDQLVGGDGRDRLAGGPGDDWLDGGADGDSVDGGPNDDMVLGGRGPDTLTAGSGDDVVIASDGARDKIDCGKGRDIAVVDRSDRTKRCEVVRRTRAPSKR